MVNIESPNFDEPREQDGFRAQRARISRQAGAVKLDATHYGEEEMVVILSGQATLRSPDGERGLERASSLSFYPDSGKIGCFERRPEGGGLYELHLRENAVGYYEGESPPG